MSDLRTESTGAAMSGTVSFRCSACGELVDATDAVWAWPGGSAGPNEIKPFHPHHTPDKET